ncbi:hypothetical protein ACH5A7_20960 [Streptomyces sp. NPDC018955]|uniref:hypothetical protein n=1 Tax=Streptomyces sp. NPDC018955 TaxID=3365055 RepID=UPI0037A3CDE2
MPEELTVRKLIQYVPACDTGRHVIHPMETCDEYEAYCATVRAWWVNSVEPIFTRTPMTEVPPSLRGPNWTGLA